MGAVVNPFTGKIDFTGTAPSSGGAFTGGTPGSVLFVGGTASSPTFAQDNQGLYYNDTNNRLSVFTTLGNEVLANGDFTGSAAGWILASGWAYSANSVSKTSNGTGTLSQTFNSQITTEYLLTYTVSGWTVGTVTPSLGGVTGTAVSANGTYTERFVATTTAGLAFTPSNTARFTIDTISLKPLVGTSTASNISVGGVNVQGSWSNGSPSTSRAFTFNNIGTYTWTDYRFSGTLRSAIGADSSGQVNIYQSGGSGVAFYSGNSGLTSNQLYSYSTSSVFYHSGYAYIGSYGAIVGGVHAGAGSAPTSTLQSAGGLALKTKRLTASGTLDNTATHWLLDATNASACTGTPSVTTCSTYTASGQATCESHLPCVWNAGSSCSAFSNESGMGTCAGTSGCSVATASCSGAGDQTSCESQDDAYGGNCAWDAGTNTCSSYTNTTDCNNNSPCYANVGTDCSYLSDGGGDGTNCATQPECSYDSGTGTCSGYHFTSCDGDNSTPSCTGTYNTGSCTGTYGSACEGTVTCASYSSSGPCTGETGCTWSSVLSATLVDGLSYPDRTLFVSNDASNGADSIIYPATTSPATTINGASSYTLSQYQDGVHLNFYQTTYDCSNYVSAGTCTPQGCSIVYANCSYDTMTGYCTGNAVCPAHDNNQSACEAQTYFSQCTGTQIVARDWRVYADVSAKSGTYTPTLTNTTNISASTARLATYMRVGNTVTVSGQLDIDPTAAGAVLLGISLPIASNFTTAYQLGGVGSTTAIANESYGIEADSTNDRASMKNIAVSTANHTVAYTFTYQIL